MAEPLHHLLDVAATRFPARTGLVTDERELRYGELAEESRRVAGWLRDLGVRRGDRVVMALPNCAEHVATLFAVARLGAVFVILNDSIKPYHLGHIVQDAAPKVLLTSDDRDLPPEVGRGVRVLTASDYRRDVPSATPPPPFPGITVDPVCLIYTSGSTAKPKGVVSTHRQVRFAAAAIQARIGIQADDIIGTFLPLSFDYGLYQVFLACQAGATLGLGPDAYAGPGLLRALCRWNVTVLPLVPSIASTLIRLVRRSPHQQLPPLRRITNTGARLSSHEVRQLQAAFPGCDVVLMFGLTECKRVSILAPGDYHRKPSSVGTPLPDTECLIVDEEGRQLPPGEVGELVVRGPHVMSGYWNAPELTTTRFRRWGNGLERVLFTGDRCSLDDEGFLYFHGRSDEIYKSRGFRVSPFEVEDAARDVPGVREAALVPPTDGHGAVLYVTGEATAREVMAQLRSRLEDFKVPARIIVLDELPLNANGKTDKQALRAYPSQEAMAQ